MPGYHDAYFEMRKRMAEAIQGGEQPSGPLNLPPAQQRMSTAMRMQSFYEPGHFGPTETSWGDWSFSPVPSTMGGFDYRPLDDQGGIAVPDWARGALPDNGQLVEQFKARQPYDAPMIGPANLQSYGVGQLQRYGVGALRAYQPLAREEQLRWRTR